MTPLVLLITQTHTLPARPQRKNDKSVRWARLSRLYGPQEEGSFGSLECSRQVLGFWLGRPGEWLVGCCPVHVWRLSDCGAAKYAQTARVWNVESHLTGRELVLKGHTDSVDQLAWHPSEPLPLLLFAVLRCSCTILLPTCAVFCFALGFFCSLYTRATLTTAQHTCRARWHPCDSVVGQNGALLGHPE